MREVLENCNNLEHECSAAGHSLAPDLRPLVAELRGHWDHLRTISVTGNTERSSTPVKRSIPVERSTPGRDSPAYGELHVGKVMVAVY